MEDSEEAKKTQDELLISIQVQLLPGETRLEFAKRVKKLIEEKTGLVVVFSGVPLEE